MTDQSEADRETAESNLRELEQGIQTDLKKKLTYAAYLGLEKVLTAQEPLSDPQHHDEMLFIIQHQTSELWLKLIIHELQSALGHIRNNRPGPVTKILSRVKQVQRQLFEQWAVLETLTPTEYSQFREVLGFASGFQSLQYRTVEFLLGNKNKSMLKLFEHDPTAHASLKSVLEAPAIYDEFLLFLSRRGHAIPERLVVRDWREPLVRDAELFPVF
jgi:tryptophan 2,3-dioxygenase